MANDVYGSEIEKAVAMGFIAGFQDNTFRPQGFLTREQLVSMVIEGLGKLPGATITVPTQASGRPYRDVEAGRWSAAKIQWARDNNIVSGYPDGTFRPNKSVTRAELMAVQKKAAEFAKSLQGQPGVLVSTESVTQFSDTEGHWAVALISEMSAYCQVASPLNERGNAFLPDSQARRNYAAAATLRMLNCVQQPITQK
ncbi:MAG: S-layer homology domain-containing protein [Moorea sp. SIO3E2]|nr:S-layer homology domain-containing protein [Moorena sp. SIO3E2]